MHWSIWCSCRVLRSVKRRNKMRTLAYASWACLLMSIMWLVKYKNLGGFWECYGGPLKSK